MGSSDDFGFLRKILIIPNMDEIGHFWVQNQSFFDFPIKLLRFSDIIPGESH